MVAVVQLNEATRSTTFLFVCLFVLFTCIPVFQPQVFVVTVLPEQSLSVTRPLTGVFIRFAGMGRSNMGGDGGVENGAG